MVQQIIQELMTKMKLTEEQAKGGLGILLKTCQEKLAAQDFSKITALLENSNWQELIKNAPTQAKSKLSGFASMFGEKATQLAQYANIAGSFKALNIDITKIKQFIEVVTNYLQEKGGPQAKEMLGKFWK